MPDNIDLEALRVPEADPLSRFTIRDFIGVCGVLFELVVDPETGQTREIPGLRIELLIQM